MRSVFQINTVYQLFITINMRLHSIPDGNVDLIVTDHTPALKNYIPSLQESRLFQHIFYIESLQFNNYFWGVDSKDKPDAFHNCSRQLERFLNPSEICYEYYTDLYVANLDAYTKCIYRQYPNLNIYQIEDGASVCSTDWKELCKKWDYIDGFNKIYDEVRALYLYTPDLICFEYPAPKLILPKVEKTGQALRAFNQIFQYKPIRFPKFVFVEQSFQVDNIKNNDLEFLQATFDIVGYENLYIKPHPRNTIHRPFSYGLSRMEDDSIPFELMFLNSETTNSKFITVDSGSLISTRVIFEEDTDTLLLYRAITGKSHIHGAAAFSSYMDKFAEKYASPHLLIPDSLEEYRCMLTHLR